MYLSQYLEDEMHSETKDSFSIIPLSHITLPLDFPHQDWIENLNPEPLLCQYETLQSTPRPI